MNLTKLFESQKILRDRINYQGEDRFEKLVLALLVELGELANEQRSWKFWSKDQKPRTEAQRQGKTASGLPARHIETYNPLLEEYADGIHFLIELALELGMRAEQIESFVGDQKKVIGSMSSHFGYLYHLVSELMDTGSLQDKRFKLLLIANAYIGLGYRLGFTWEEVETAYFEKNAENHRRQESGY